MISREHDREPQPGDGPEYHDNHAAWRSRQERPIPRIETTVPKLRRSVQVAYYELRAEQPLVGPGRTISVDEWSDRIIKHLGDDVSD